VTTTLAGVGKRYRRSGPWALNGIDLVISPGTTTVVVGRNGSGKSTLVRIATGVSLPTVGRITGRPGAVGYAPERLPARLPMTARTYLGHMARLRGLREGPAREAADELCAWLDLQPGPDVAIRTLSKGNNQKVALIQAFLAPVGLLALDEPTSGLDVHARALLRDLVERRRADGTAILLTSHAAPTDVGCDRVVELSEGRLMSLSSAATLVRIELDGPDLTAVAGRPGVHSTSPDGRVFLVAADSADSVLLWALQHQCSVVSVRSFQEP
jgi:ABC-2 type transport system ATP-binding protein